MEQLKRRRQNNAKAQESSSEQKQQQQVLTDEFKPIAEWHQNPDSHILVLELPGFRKDDLKVQVDSSGKLTLKGTRKATVSKHHLLDKTFQVPEDANIDQISGKLDDGRLTLLMPRKVVSAEKESGIIPSKENGKPSTEAASPAGEEEKKDGREEEEEGCCWLGEEDEELWGNCLVERLMEKVNENRKLIAAAVVAFSFGFFVSRKLRSSG